MALANDYAGQACSLARSLEIIGERWTLLIVRDAFRYAMAAMAPKAAPLGRTSRRCGFSLTAWSCLAWLRVLVLCICRRILRSGRSVH
jgi:hypothetical protein